MVASVSELTALRYSSVCRQSPNNITIYCAHLASARKGFQIEYPNSISIANVLASGVSGTARNGAPSPSPSFGPDEA